MRKMIVPLAVLAALSVAGPAAAARSVPYKGKTSSGHKVTFKVKNGRMHNLTAGVRTSCLPIQGGGMPLGGPEIFGFRGSVRLKAHMTWTFTAKPAFHYSEVTMKHDLHVKRRKGAMSGRMRLQYSTLVPKYPIGTFSVYSCLGGATFTAKAR